MLPFKCPAPGLGLLRLVRKEWSFEGWKACQPHGDAPQSSTSMPREAYGRRTGTLLLLLSAYEVAMMAGITVAIMNWVLRY